MALVSALATGSILGWGMVPLIAIGMAYYQYNSADPESHPTNAREVSE